MTEQPDVLGKDPVIEVRREGFEAEQRERAHDERIGGRHAGDDPTDEPLRAPSPLDGRSFDRRMGARVGDRRRGHASMPSRIRASSRSPSREGAATPRRWAARTTDPVIASSSVGLPAAASRALEVVRSYGNPSMIAHCPAGSRETPSAAATAHASARAASRRGRQRAARSAPTGSPRGDGGRCQDRQARGLVPEHRSLVTGDHDLDPGNAERRERGLQGFAFEIA